MALGAVTATGRLMAARSLQSTGAFTSRRVVSVFPTVQTALRTYASKSFPDHTVVAMPALSPTMTQGNLASWSKSAGDQLVAGDILAEIETDKAQMDFEVTDEGYLAKTLVDSGTHDIQVGSPIAVVVEDEADVAAFADFTVEDAGGAVKKDAPKEDAAAPKEEEKKPEQPAPEAPKSSEPAKPAESKPEAKPVDKVFASPAAKRVALELGVPLTKVKGSGPNGRILQADVEKFKPEAAAAPAAAATAGAPVFDDIPLSGMRKTIAKRLSESKNGAPHYYITINASVDKLLKLREALNAKADGRYKLSVNDLIVKACASALKKVPEANSSWMGDFVRQYKNVDISVAVATPAGLITPVVKGADTQGLESLSNSIKDLGKRARDSKLKPEEYQGGTFTVSNLGMYDVEQFTAIINPPQTCILAVGSTTEHLAADPLSEKGFKVVRKMKLTLSADHRVVDGAVGARFTSALKKVLEEPLELLI